MIGNQPSAIHSTRENGNGACHPPRNSVVASAETGDDVDVLREEEHRELQRGVLGVEAADELALGLGEVERRAVGLARDRDDVDDERHRQRDDEPAVVLRRDDLAGRQRAGVEEHGDERERHGDLVADDLRRGAQPPSSG
jgi:hypothetical protein